jgi:hypothetical protein
MGQQVNRSQDRLMGGQWMKEGHIVGRVNRQLMSKWTTLVNQWDGVMDGLSDATMGQQMGWHIV